jgi:hypothetical protein
MLRSNHVPRQSCFTLPEDIKSGNHINHSPHGHFPGTLPDQRTIINPWIISTSSRWNSHFTGSPPGLDTNNNYYTGHVLPVSIAFSNLKTPASRYARISPLDFHGTPKDFSVSFKDSTLGLVDSTGPFSGWIFHTRTFLSTGMNTTHGIAWTSAPSVPLCGVRLQGSIWLKGLAIQFDCILGAAALDIRHWTSVNGHPSFPLLFLFAGYTMDTKDLYECFPTRLSTQLDHASIAIPT